MKCKFFSKKKNLIKDRSAASDTGKQRRDGQSIRGWNRGVGREGGHMVVYLDSTASVCVHHPDQLQTNAAYCKACNPCYAQSPAATPNMS